LIGGNGPSAEGDLGALVGSAGGAVLLDGPNINTLIAQRVRDIEDVKD
jgi:hypothetical protein